MKYLLQVYMNGADALLDALPDREKQAVYNEYRTIAQGTGVIDAHQLQPPATASTVHVDEGTIITRGGPFADGSEPLGGYYLIEADDLGAAIRVASRIPAARMGGAIEVRPVVDA